MLSIRGDVKLVSKNEYIDMFEIMLRSSTVLMDIMRRARNLELEDYYISAGCVMQMIWNKFSGYDDLYGIKDIDLVYYNGVNISEVSEKILEKKVREIYSDIELDVDVTNEARVHIWYKDKFGYDIDPYKSVEDAIRTWPTTASAIGVRLDEEDNIILYAPFGIGDLMNMVIRPNKVQITEEIYMNKVRRWQDKWPALSIDAW